MSSDWSFARRPFWLFSHVFAATVVVSFALLGVWQLSRHFERADLNEVIRSRSNPPATSVDEALALPADEIEFRLAGVTGSYVDGDLVRVANRSQGGVGGQHVVALFRLDDGRQLLVNRGFVPLDPSIVMADAPSGPQTLTGWLRGSVEKGWLGSDDNGDGDVAPRFNVEAIAARIDGDQTVLPFWLLLDGTDETSAPATFPDLVPLPALNAGPHLSYMGQWFIFAVLGVGFYIALLRRHARGGAEPVLLDD